VYKTASSTSSYDGLFFYTFKDNGDLQYQGIVKRTLPSGNILVQLYSWAMGEEHGQETISPDVVDLWFDNHYEFLKHGAKLMAMETESRYGKEDAGNAWDYYKKFDTYYEHIYGDAQ
jgi:hypothetical protein